MGELRQKYHFSPSFRFSQELVRIFAKFKRRHMWQQSGRSKTGIPTSKDRRERMIALADSVKPLTTLTPHDITSLALADWIYGSSAVSELPDAARRAADLIINAGGRPKNYAMDYLIPELAMFYQRGTKREPSRQFKQGKHESEFMRFCEDCMIILGISVANNESLRNHVDRAFQHMAKAGVRERKTQFSKWR